MSESKAKAKKEPTFYAPKAGLKTKVCSITGKNLPISDFWKDKYMKDGYTSYSKEGYNLRWIKKDPKYQSKKYQNMNREK